MTWPTMRLLKSLQSGWTNPAHESSVKRQAWNELPLFSDLGHPALQACQDFEANPGSKKYTEHQASTRHAGYKVIEARDLSKGPGWRTAVIRMFDTAWAVFADAHDKFHTSAANAFRESRRGETEPTVFDINIRAIKLQETEQAALIASWQRQLIRSVLDLFKEDYLSTDKNVDVSVKLPEPPDCLLQSDSRALGLEIRVAVVHDDRESSLEEDEQEPEALVEILVSFAPWSADEEVQNLVLTTVLPVIDPWEEKWTREAASYDKNGNMSFSYDMSVARASQLIFAAESEDDRYFEPEDPQPTQQAHYIVRGELAASVVECRPIRSVCGLWFVSSRVPDGLPICRDCMEGLPDASFVRALLDQLH